MHVVYIALYKLDHMHATAQRSRNMVQTVFKLLVHALAFASHAILARPDYNNAAFIPPGENFQDYLCGNGSLLHSNMTLVLGGGVHRIPPGPFCFVSNVSNILITGSSSNVTIRCEGERGFGFIAVRNLTIERVTIVGCGQTDTRISQTQEDQTVPVVFYFERSFDICIRQMKLTSFRGFGAYGYALNKASMSEVVFEGCAINASCSAGLFSQVDSCWDAVQLQPQEMTLIVQSCTYRSLSGVAESFSAGLSLCGCVNATILDSAFDGLEGTSISATDANVSIENSTFVGNRATDIIMEDSNTSVSRCRFNGHGDEAISITSTGSVATYIADSVFQNYEINVLDVFIGTGDTRVTNCTFQDNGEYTITLVNGRPLAAPRDNYGGPMACTVQLSKCTFTRNRPGKVRIAINDDAASIMNCSTVITDCKFYRNRAFINDVIMPIRSLLNVDIAFAAERDVTIHITDSIFKENTDVGGITIGSFMHVQVYISRCIFEKNIRGQSIYYLFIYEIGRGDVPVSFAVTDCTFMNNTLDDYRGVGISVEQRVMAWQMNVVVTGCTFQGNYGGAVYLVNVFGNIEIENCNFIENNADTSGSGLAIVVDHQIKSNVLVRNSTFINNSAAVGGAAIYSVNQEYSTRNHISLIDVAIKGCHCNPCDHNSRMLGGAVYLERTNMMIGGERGSEFTSNGPQGAIQGSNTVISLWGKVTFTNNTGDNGGAIGLSNYGQIVLYSCDTVYKECKSNITFSGNSATKFGGAVYIATNIVISSTYIDGCAISYGDEDSDQPCLVAFRSNYAQLAGHAIYASPIYYCSRIKVRNPLDHFDIIPFTGTSNDSQIVSFPACVMTCCDSQNLCDTCITSSRCQTISTFPGRTIRIYASLVDHGNSFSPGVIYTRIEGSDYQNVRLGDHQNALWVAKKRSTMEYQIYGPENTTFNLLLSGDAGYSPTVIEVNLMQCVPWFPLMTDSNGLMKCDCSPFLISLRLVCDSVNGTVARKGTNWIGLYTNKAQSVPALVITCPLNYCKSNFTHLSLQSIEEDICNGGRTGILCGHCYENYSVVFGSPGCQVCSDMWLISLALYAILGASLVAILFILNLTVTQGTLYGFIFYANIIQVNTSIFFNQSVLVPLQVMISFINLDLGFPLCFYDGMDDAAKTGLQFVFPAYLLTLTITVIVVCHYFLSRPTHQSSSRRCLGRLSYLVGQRAVGVLSTLIYLSYSKLLRTVVDVFLYSTLYLPEGSILIWFYDGNIKYLHGKHLVLFVVAMVICILFLIPYTLALTFIPIIEHFSEHNRVFHCLSMMVNRVKPMNDAHYAPYKGEWRWWLGARLWFLVFMYALNPVYSSENPSLLLLIHGSTMIFFISVQGYFQPFGVQMPANYSRSISILNACYNWLDLFSLINYAILAHSVSYILDHDSDPVQMNVAIGVLIGTFGAVFLTAVLFHVIVAFLKVCNMYDTVKQKIHNHVSVEHTHSSATVELQRPTNTAVINTDYCAIREPLLLEEI